MVNADRSSTWLGTAVASAIVLGLLLGCDDSRSVSAPRPPLADVPPSEDGVALAVVYDTSGSMKESVTNAAGASEPKFEIASRALAKVIDRLEAFQSAPAPTPRRLDFALYTFSVRSVDERIGLAPFDARAVRARVARFGAPDAGTPLGLGLEAATAAVLRSTLSRRHVLVITDGLNTTGPEPAEVLPQLRERAKRVDSEVSVHFVAFDVDAQVFDSLKRLDVTVLAASDERTLDSQLGFILEKKILLEDEEPAATSPPGNK
jgi:hypothetical protein